MLNVTNTDHNDEYKSALDKVISQVAKQKSILLLEKRLCEQEERHKKTENQLKNETNCLKKQICQLRYVL